MTMFYTIINPKGTDYEPFHIRTKHMTTNVFQLTEQELSVDVMNVKEFTQENVITLDTLRSKLAYPRIYGAKAPKGIKHLTTQLIDVADVDAQNEYFDQLARVGVNPEMGSISDDIRVNGYSLTELPIAVMKVAGGKYIILEGRTRFSILSGFGMKNIIADVFDETTPANALRFAVAQNAQKKPYGAASFRDVHKAVLELIKMGEIDHTASNFTDLVLEEIGRLTTKLAPSEVNRIVHDANDIAHGERRVISFPQGQGVEKWLEENDYTNNRELIYHPVSTFEAKVMMAAIRKAKATHKDVREIRLVVHGGTLDAKDPAGDWIKRCKGFKKTFNDTLKDISKEFFGDMPIRMDRVKLYGAIPQVKALEDKYPMDELYLFD